MSICCKNNVKLMYNFRNLPLYKAERVLLYEYLFTYISNYNNKDN